MRFVDWLRGRKLDDELDTSVSELFARASAPSQPDAGQHARVRARVGAELEASPGLNSPLGKPGLGLFGATSMFASLWNATASHRVAATVAGAALLLGSGMAAEASGLGPSVRDAVQHAVQGEDEENEELELQHHDLDGEDNHAAIVESNDDIEGNLIKHIGGSGNLHIRGILVDVDDAAVTVDGPGDDGEPIPWSTDPEVDPKIQIPGARAGGEDPTFEELLAELKALLDEDDGNVIVIVEGTCTDDGEGGYDCEVSRLTVLGNSRPENAGGPPEGVGGGAPEGVGQADNENLGGGKPENPGKPEGVGKPDNTPPDDE
jgi:hypothetical protein